MCSGGRCWHCQSSRTPESRTSLWKTQGRGNHDNHCPGSSKVLETCGPVEGKVGCCDGAWVMLSEETGLSGVCGRRLKCKAQHTQGDGEFLTQVVSGPVSIHKEKCGDVTG